MNLISKIFNGAKKETKFVVESEHRVISETKAKPKEKKEFNREVKIITARPADMSFTDYRIYLVKQREWLKRRKAGFLVYKSIEWFDREVENKHGKKEKTKVARHFPPFVGRAKYDLLEPV